MQIKTRRGLNIPIKGDSKGPVENLPAPKRVALDLDPFEEIKFKLLVRVGDTVSQGQPLLFDKKHPKRQFVSPAAGTVAEVRRGLKRRLLAIVIERGDEVKHHESAGVNIAAASREELVEAALSRGLFAHLRMRPFNLLANPEQTPRAIFVKAVESAPFVPPAEMQIEGFEEDFAYGLEALAKLSAGAVHLVIRKGTDCRALLEAKHVEIHTAYGPHPISSPSLHIQRIDPIRSADDLIWTATAHDVISIGRALRTGQTHNSRVISIAGEGILPDRRQFVRVHDGHPIDALLADRSANGPLRLISGNPLTGKKVEIEDYLGFHHFAFTVLPESNKRQFLHFFRPGFGKYTALKAYASGHLPSRPYSFTTSSHGEERAFIDGRIYDKVQPLKIPTMPLVKSVIARDWDRAEALGLLEIDAEDFALPTFICPSKVEMVQIIKEGLAAFSAEVLA